MTNPHESVAEQSTKVHPDPASRTGQAIVRWANCDDALIEINVSNTQVQHFSDTKPASVQEPENLWHDEVP
jgi:hypothetical protein